MTYWLLCDKPYQFRKKKKENFISFSHFIEGSENMIAVYAVTVFSRA